MNKLHKVLHNLKTSSLGSFITQAYIYMRYVCYLCWKPLIVRRIHKKEQLTILFFMADVSMWKCDGLFNQLLTIPKYNPIIVPLLYPHETIDSRRKIQDNIKHFCALKKYPYHDGYDFINQIWYDAKQLQPDIVIFPQPYNTGHKLNKIEHFWLNSLFVYIPYCLKIERDNSMYNTLLINIAKVFAPTSYMISDLKNILYSKAKNIVVTGYFLADEIQKEHPDPWLQDNHKTKRIIWAPHHSINDFDILDYSTFLDVADIMIELAKKYADRCQFAFKPHPKLMDKLYRHPQWGKEKTDQYYAKWNSLPNGFSVQGEYVGLFQHSDALIHDCSSFSAEYLCFNKPAFYLTKSPKQHLKHLNDFGKECFNLHYTGISANEIEEFINKVVINQFDSLQPKRECFASTNFTCAEQTVAQKMTNEIANV